MTFPSNVKHQEASALNLLLDDILLLLMIIFQAMLQLARMYLTVDDLDACQQQCVQLLKMDSENDDATVVSTCIVTAIFETLAPRACNILIGLSAKNAS